MASVPPSPFCGDPVALILYGVFLVLFAAYLIIHNGDDDDNSRPA